MFNKKLVENHFYALIGYLGITLLFTCPLLFKFSTYIPGDGRDGLLYFWNLWWNEKALLSLKTNPFFCDYIFYPVGTVSYFPAIFNFFVSLPFQLLFNLTVGYNIVVVFSFLFSAYGAYLLVNYLVKDRWAAFISGFIFAFCPYKFAHLLGHMSLVSSEWIPFFVLYLIKMTRSEFSMKYSVLAGVFMLLTAWCSYYYIIFIILFTFFYWLYLAITEKNLIINRNFYKKIMLLLGIPFLGMLPIVISSFDDIIYKNYVFSNIGTYTEFVSDFLGFFTPSFFHPVFRTFVHDIYMTNFTGGVSESNVFIGYTVLALVIYALLKKYAWRKEFNFWFYSAIIFFVLSLGPKLHLYGKEYQVFLPAWVLRWIPIFKGVRCYSRLSIMAMLSLSVFIGYVCNLIFQKARYRFLPFVSLLFFISFEYLPVPYPMSETAVPEIYNRISQESGDFTILEIPLGWNISSTLFGRPDIRYQFWQTKHQKRLVGGVIPRGSITQVDHFFEMPFLNKIFYLQGDIPFELLLQEEDKKDILEIIKVLKIKYILIHSPYIGSEVHRYIQDELPVKLEEVAVPSPDICRAGINRDNNYEDDEIIAFKILEEKAASEINFIQYKQGWYSSEKWNNEFFMYWSKGKKSLLAVYLYRIAGYQIRMRVIPFPLDTMDQTVKIFVNRRFLCEQKLMKGWNEYTIFVPESFWKLGENIVKFRYKFTARPNPFYRRNVDTRPLAMGLDYIKLFLSGRDTLQ